MKQESAPGIYLSQMLTRHQKACSDGMFISSIAARGACKTKKSFQNTLFMKLFILENGKRFKKIWTLQIVKKTN